MPLRHDPVIHFPPVASRWEVGWTGEGTALDAVLKWEPQADTPAREQSDMIGAQMYAQRGQEIITRLAGGDLARLQELNSLVDCVLTVAHHLGSAGRGALGREVNILRERDKALKARMKAAEEAAKAADARALRAEDREASRHGFRDAAHKRRRDELVRDVVKKLQSQPPSKPLGSLLPLVNGALDADGFFPLKRSAFFKLLSQLDWS